MSVGCQKVQYETCGSDGVHYHDHTILEVTPCSLIDRDNGATCASTMLLSIFHTTRCHIPNCRNIKSRLPASNH